MQTSEPLSDATCQQQQPVAVQRDVGWMREEGLEGGKLFVSHSMSEMQQIAFPLKKWTTYPEGATELAPHRWNQVLVHSQLRQPPVSPERKGPSSLPRRLYLPTSPGPVGLSFPLSQFLLLTKPCSDVCELLAWQEQSYFLGWFSAILVS